MLSGVVEVGETYIRGKEANKHNSKKLKAGRGSVGRRLWVCASEVAKLK